MSRRPNTGTAGAILFSAAAEAMRRILVENARRKLAEKRGRDWQRVDLDELAPEVESPCDDVLAPNEAVEKLEAKDKRRADVVKLRFFAGLTIPQTASALNISASTVDNDWAYARAWLRLEVAGEAGQSSD